MKPITSARTNTTAETRNRFPLSRGGTLHALQTRAPSCEEIGQIAGIHLAVVVEVGGMVRVGALGGEKVCKVCGVGIAIAVEVGGEARKIAEV